MQIETKNLFTITNFSKQKGLTRQHVHRLINIGTFNSIIIDGVTFIVNDEKATNFTRTRKEKKVNKKIKL